MTHPAFAAPQTGLSPVLPLIGSRICVVEVLLWTGMVCADATLAPNARTMTMRAAASSTLRNGDATRRGGRMVSPQAATYGLTWLTDGDARSEQKRSGWLL